MKIDKREWLEFMLDLATAAEDEAIIEECLWALIKLDWEEGVW